MILSKEGMKHAKALAREFRRINENKKEVANVINVWEEVREFFTKMVKALLEVMKPLVDFFVNLKMAFKKSIEIERAELSPPLKLSPFISGGIRNQI